MSTILLAHPDSKTCEAVSSILENGGHRVFTAQDGPACVELFKRERPDIVILNEQLPKMTSTRVFTEIQHIDPETKVLVFALREIGEERELPAKFGIRAFRPGEVLQIVEELQAGAERPGAGGERFAFRILVVDDNPGILKVLQRFLTDKGYEVRVATSGAAALPMLKKMRPHLVLLDIDMPEMDGVQTLRRIREIDGQVGVIMVTGNDTIETMERCRAYGAYDYVVKPFDFAYLAFSVYSKIVVMTLL
jgi:DNA-binding response OmpR family regulator